MPSQIDTLRAFRFLDPLHDAELAALSSQVEEKQYPADATLFADAQIGEQFYLLKTGRVQIFKPTPAGEVTLNMIESGEHFGEMSLLDNQPRSAGARAMSDVTVIEVAKPVFLALVQRFPILLYRAAQVNSERLRNSDQKLIAELGERNKELTQLYDTSLDITRHLEIKDALVAIKQRAAALLNSQHGLIHLYDPASKKPIAQTRENNKVSPDIDTVMRVFESGESVVQKKHSQQELIVPIRLDTQMLGTLSVQRPASAREFTNNDSQLLLLFANQAAIAIENARLFALALEKSRLDRELQVAREVQRSLIPAVNPTIPGFQIAGLWRPAREVSGDFYDFISLADGCWGIVIADVCDKGMPAALFMATARSVLRASIRDSANLTAAIEHANRIVAEDARNGMFVTLFVAVLNPKTNRLEYVNGGHNPPLWLRAGKTHPTQLRRTGLPLAIYENSPYASCQIDIAKGDMLLFYTDGVTDATNAHKARFGDTRLTRILKANAKNDALKIVDALDTAVRDFVGNYPVFDDITMIALRR